MVGPEGPEGAGLGNRGPGFQFGIAALSRGSLSPGSHLTDVFVNRGVEMTFSSVTFCDPWRVIPVSRKLTSPALASPQSNRCQALSASKHSRGLFRERVGLIG